MRKIFSWFVVCTFVGLLALVFIPEPVDAMTGSGTAEDPYVIYNVTDLQNMQNDLSAYYVLNCSIDASATQTWNWDAGRGVYEGFAPISGFTGSFDGNHYSITGVHIDLSGTSCIAGLFASFGNPGTGTTIVCNVSILDADITGRATGQNSDGCFGVLAGALGASADVHISGVIVSGDVVGYKHGEYTGVFTYPGAGGLIGYCHGGDALIEKCAAYVDVECFAVGGHYAHSMAGGFVGYIHDSSSLTFRNCYARGDVHAFLEDSYSWDKAGGFFGYRLSDAVFENCYATGFVSAEDGQYDYAGGFGGGGSGCSNCFWDTDTSEKSASSCGTGKATSQMKTESTFTDAGWNFTTIWAIGGAVNDGYPYLQWWYNPPDIIDDIYQVVWFQPNAIIEGTELPNRAQSGTLIDGEIHWGANPAGITITHGELIPEEEYNFEPIVPSSQDIIKPEPEAMTTDVDTARLVDNPLYPLVHALGSMPGLNDRLVWLMLAWLAVIASMLFVHIGFDTKKGTEKPQHFVLTTITGLGLSILFYTMGIFDIGVVILMAMGLVGAIIWERQPVL